MSTVFNQRFKHGRLDFHPGVPYLFEDADARAYFVALGVAAEDEDVDPTVTITEGELDIHPLIVWNHVGSPLHAHYVMPARAAEHRGITLAEAEAYVWTGEEVDQHV